MDLNRAVDAELLALEMGPTPGTFGVWQRSELSCRSFRGLLFDATIEVHSREFERVRFALLSLNACKPPAVV